MTAPTFAVLHAARVKGLASDEILAALAGLSIDELTGVAAPLVDEGLLIRREGRFSGFAPTPAGRAEAERLLAEDAETTAALPELTATYEAFLPLNSEFKRICQTWQLRGQEPNDHTDAAYDAAVVEDLADLHQQWRLHLTALTEPLPRIGRYAPRLDTALEKVRNGDTGAFARPMYDSYHDIWMELHEDLILSLGRKRDEHDEGEDTSL